MLAVVKDFSRKGISLQDVPTPEMSPYEVLIKVRAVGICGSDARIYNEVMPGRKKIIIGHELSGEIVQCGEQVHDLRKGERVVTEICIGCAICRYCKKGLINLCDRLEEVGITVDGGMAEFVSIPARNVHPIPKNVSFEEATLADPLACTIRGLEMVSVQPESWVTILGPGTIGLLAVQVAKKILRAKVIVTGTRDERLALAEEFGADYVVNVHDSTKRNGSVVSMTVHKEININIEPVIRNELKVFGSICYNYKEFDEALDLIRKGKINVEEFTGHTFPLKEADKAFDFLMSRKGVKVIVRPE